MILMVVYQIITASTADVYWDLISSCLVTIVVCGDSIILLLYDRRWKASLKELMESIRKMIPD